MIMSMCKGRIVAGYCRLCEQVCPCLQVMTGPSGFWVKPLGWASLEVANLYVEHPGYGQQNPIATGHLVKVGLCQIYRTCIRLTVVRCMHSTDTETAHVCFGCFATPSDLRRP